ncbi:gamma-type small acid-soluble spore protein [Neobacillus piezotolerans]|uniref:Gamma-type small acid-soluble spore protein n=1 Tax=Neobacillus piezotolerans TaxID=2259171 RepID=A0A3D8GWT5_9BACI|nr:gamma-type small acid-soluble spore protein [Neobacillus piezotolerans]RDU38908.1 gamma-type small acid-soluble spore protein [Neobacillus piezotolerans]
MEQNNKNFTSVGTDIDEVKRLNAESGLSYNEVKELLAKTGGKGTALYSDTDVEEVKRQIQNSNEE